jgi:hypothetical protein
MSIADPNPNNTPNNNRAQTETCKTVVGEVFLYVQMIHWALIWTKALWAYTWVQTFVSELWQAHGNYLLRVSLQYKACTVNQQFIVIQIHKLEDNAYRRRKINALHFKLRTEIAQSLERLATGWTVQGSNAGGGEIFRTRPDRPWGPPSLLYNGYRVFPRGKSAGVWRWPHTPSSAEVKERVELYIYSQFWP